MIVGGAQENTLLTVKGLAEKGHEVVLVTGPSPGPEGELLKKVGGLTAFEIVETPLLVRELHPYRDLAAFFWLKRFFRERQFDVVHTHSSKAGIIGRAAARAAGTALVVHTIHGQAFHPYEKPWRNFMYKTAERWAARKSDRILAVAQAMVDQCVEAGIADRSMYAVVRSGMELEPFLNAQPDPALRRSLGIPDGCPVVGTLARLFPLKGYEDFMPAAAEVASAFPDARFLIVGDGVLKDSLAAEVSRLGFGGRFVFAGLVPPHEVHRYLALMDVLVHLSLREGLPRSVVQALATGKPAVTFALDGAPEVVLDGETGRLLAPGDVQGVAAAIKALLGNRPLAGRLGEAGRRFVAERFDWRLMVDLIEKEYFSRL